MKDNRVAVTVTPTVTLALAVLACLPGFAARAEDPSWEGWFVGVNAGASLSNITYHSGPNDKSFFRSAAETANMWYDGRYDDPRFSPIAGLSVAYNTQVDSFVWGAELGLNALDADLGRTATHPLTHSNHHYTLQQRAEASGLATLRGRFGFAFDNSLLSLTGGIAGTWLESGFDYRDDDVGTAQYHGSGMKRQFKLGPTVGLAYEYMLSDAFVLKGEYSYVDLGRTKVSGLITAASGTRITDFHNTSELYLNVFTIGIERKF